MDALTFLGFGIYAWITIVTVVTMFTILLFTKWRTDFVFLAAIGVLFVTGGARREGGFLGLQQHIRHHCRRAVRGRGGFDAYGCVAVDCEAYAGHTWLILQGGDQADAASGGAEFVSQQHHRRDTLRQYC